MQESQAITSQTSSTPALESRVRNVDRIVPDRAINMAGQGDQRERNGESSVLDRGNTSVTSQAINNNSQTPVATATSGLVGDRRISLRAGAGCAGLAAQLEQGYRLAREAVRANNGIKVLLLFLRPRIYLPPAALDCLRALACRVLLGLARDDTIAHILTKLQVFFMILELFVNNICVFFPWEYPSKHVTHLIEHQKIYFQFELESNISIPENILFTVLDQLESQGLVWELRIRGTP